jgi:hypothetical protein
MMVMMRAMLMLMGLRMEISLDVCLAGGAFLAVLLLLGWTGGQTEGRKTEKENVTICAEVGSIYCRPVLVFFLESHFVSLEILALNYTILLGFSCFSAA